MFALQLTASVPRFTTLNIAAPVSKGSIFNGVFSRRSFLCRKTPFSKPYQKKKAGSAIFDSFRGGGVAGVEEDNLRFANQTMKRFEATLNIMSKWVVSGLFGVAIVLKPDPVTIWAAMGCLVNSLLSATLKRVLNHERPSALRTDPGMPSSHAQFIFYGVVFSIYSVMEWMGVSVNSVAVGAVIFITGAYLSWLRVSQQLHTRTQVIVGAILGSACSSIWIWIWCLLKHRAFDSSIRVRPTLFLGAAAYYVTFLLYAIHRWNDK